jgi:hypothetical protein
MHRRDPSQRTRENWGNFGDELGVFLIERLFNTPVEYAEYEKCDLLSIGSILGKAALYKPHHFIKPSKWISRAIDVWGSGMLTPYTHFGWCRLRFHAVRGHLTASHVPAKNHCPAMALGDPGLLADRLLNDQQRNRKKYAVGLIPHIHDRSHPRILQLSEKKGVRIINVFNHPLDVIEQIAQCEAIYSTSLHGLIIADSLQIPNAWIRGCAEVAERDFKFRDYYSIFGIENPAPIEINEELLTPPSLDKLAAACQRPGLDELKKKLSKSFPC